MAAELKPLVNKAETFDKLDIRLGRVLSVEPAPEVQKESYKLVVDFGRFGQKTTVARLTQHEPDDIIDQIIIGVLNFGNRQVGSTVSEFLLLGPQYPKAESGEASFLTTLISPKLGGKIF